MWASSPAPGARGWGEGHCSPLKAVQDSGGSAADTLTSAGCREGVGPAAGPGGWGWGAGEMGRVGGVATLCPPRSLALSRLIPQILPNLLPKPPFLRRRRRAIPDDRTASHPPPSHTMPGESAHLAESLLLRVLPEAAFRYTWAVGKIQP